VFVATCKVVIDKNSVLGSLNSADFSFFLELYILFLDILEMNLTMLGQLFLSNFKFSSESVYNNNSMFGDSCGKYFENMQQLFFNFSISFLL